MLNILHFEYYYVYDDMILDNTFLSINYRFPGCPKKMVMMNIDERFAVRFAMFFFLNCDIELQNPFAYE